MKTLKRDPRPTDKPERVVRDDVWSGSGAGGHADLIGGSTLEAPAGVTNDPVADNPLSHI